jgi:hypothetical protein
LTGEYQAPAPRDLKIRPELLAELKKGMVAGFPQGQTAPFAATRGWVQWFQGANERRTASWLAGFVPANQPRYAVAVLVESEDLGEQKDRTTRILAKIFGALFPAD